MRQFCNVCHRKIIDGACSTACNGDGRVLFRVMDADGGDVICDKVMARDGTEARELVRAAHLGDPGLRRLVCDRIVA
jgi:hypothetical protein